MTPTERVHAWLDTHPADRDRVTFAQGRLVPCRAQRRVKLPGWERAARMTTDTHREVPCHATANWTIDREPRCAQHVLRDLIETGKP